MFLTNDTWWYGTREGDRGPFKSRKEAQDALAQFIRDVRGDIELNELSLLDKTESQSDSVWDSRPDVVR